MEFNKTNVIYEESLNAPCAVLLVMEAILYSQDWREKSDIFTALDDCGFGFNILPAPESGKSNWCRIKTDQSQWILKQAVCGNSSQGQGQTRWFGSRTRLGWAGVLWLTSLRTDVFDDNSTAKTEMRREKGESAREEEVFQSEWGWGGRGRGGGE